jgi:hypothetical protein
LHTRNSGAHLVSAHRGRFAVERRRLSARAIGVLAIDPHSDSFQDGNIDAKSRSRIARVGRGLEETVVAAASRDFVIDHTLALWLIEDAINH